MHEIIRYGINGLLATGVHYGVLEFNIKVLGFASAGMANALASLFGITCSFLGSRYFVFSGAQNSLFSQAAKFCSLYGAIALLHGIILFVWADMYLLDYRVGFLIATAVQVSLSYIGNKFLVFTR